MQRRRVRRDGLAFGAIGVVIGLALVWPTDGDDDPPTVEEVREHLWSWRSALNGQPKCPTWDCGQIERVGVDGDTLVVHTTYDARGQAVRLCEEIGDDLWDDSVEVVYEPGQTVFGLAGICGVIFVTQGQP